MKWQAMRLGYVRSGQPDLTNRQMALLMVLQLEEGPHTVRGLAKRLNVCKPVICRAVTTMSMNGLVRRIIDVTDRRNVFVRISPKGEDFLTALPHFGTGRRAERAQGSVQDQPAI